MYSWISKYFFNLISYTITSVFIFTFVFNVFLGEKSIFTLLDLNNKILNLEKELASVKSIKNKLELKNMLLRNDNLDSDLISEIAQSKLGLLKDGRIIIKID